MPICLETLRAIASCNPFRWDCVPWNEKNERIEAAGLLPYLTHGHNPHHQTFVTQAVLQYLDGEYPAEAELVRDCARQPYTNAPPTHPDYYDERAVFERIDQLVAERTREALTAIAGQRSTGEAARRAL